MEEVVVTAQYAPQAAENSVYKIKVIHASEIRSRGANNLNELLRQELNIDLKQHSVFGASVEIQGISKENVKILVDGVPVTGRLNGIIDLTHISLDEIERVEIIEGPTSVFYGTDAMGGTINLISKKKQQKPFVGNVAAYGESIGALKLRAGIGYMKGKSRIRLSGGSYNFEGYSPTIDELRNREWESRSQYFGKLHATHWFNRMKMNYSGRIFNEKLIKLGEADTAHIAKDLYYHTRRVDNNLDFSGQLSDRHYLSLTAAFSNYLRYNNAYLTNVNSEEQNLSAKSRDHDTTHYDLGFFKGQFSNNQKDAFLNYTLGTEINHETIKGRRILDETQSIISYALFASANITFWKRLSLQPGFRYTYNSAYGDLFTPAFNLKWNIGKNTRLRASYAKGFRAPSLKELYLNLVVPAGPFTYHITGNEALKAEQSHNINLSTHSEINLSGSQKLIVEPALYYNDISNLIALSAIVDFKRHYININTHKTHGARLDVTYSPIPAFLLKSGVAVTGRYNSFSENQTAGSDAFLYTTDLNAKAVYCIEKKDLSLSLYYKLTGQRRGYAEVGGDLIETLIASYHILDFTIGKSLLNKNLTLNLGAKNILDVENLDTIRTPTGEAHATNTFLWGRSYFAQLEWNF